MRISWKFKGILQKLLSMLPGGERINFFLTKVFKQIPASDAVIKEKIRLAQIHLKAIEPVLKRNGELTKFYEFGAGWEMTIPITFASLGITAQTVIDIEPLLRIELVNNSLQQIPRHLPQSPHYVPITGIEDLEKQCGIKYVAPLSVTATHLPKESFDVITNTDTLEHVRAEELLDILRECYRLLKPGGIMSSLIDMRDHFFYFDPAITPYNFLRYPKSAWRKYNSPLHYQNRLRAIDYLQAFRDAGFTILSVDTPPVTDHQLRMLRQVPIALEFTKQYTEEQLLTQGLHVVTAKPA